MEQLKMMKQNLISCVQAQMGNLQNADSKELGEAIDMIKDLEEAIYYCTITKAMEDGEKEKETMKYVKPMYYYNLMGRNDPKYYDGNGHTSYNKGEYPEKGRMYYNGGSTGWYPRYMEDSYPMEIRDYREGKSPITRRMYMESKELHHDKAKQMKELEEYMRELSGDMMEMINDATPEEKEILSQKLSALAEKIK